MQNVAAVLVAGILIFAIFPVTAQLRQSQKAPTRLAMTSDPQTLYVRPGNRGLLFFSDDLTSDPANLSPWQDDYANAVIVNLAAPQYDITISDDDSQTTRPYWTRMAELMSELQWTGQTALFVADDNLISLYQARPELAETITSNIAQMIDWRMSAPALVVDVSRWDPAAQSLIAHVRASALPVAIGAHLRPASLSVARRHNWDFVICDEEAIPLHYRGQAATAWVRSITGEIPVILSPRDHDFFRDVIWVSCGAAGIWHRSLPPAGTAKNRSAALQLRATTTFLNRFVGGTLPLKSRPDHPNFIFSLEQPGVAWAGVLSAKSPVTEIPTPAYLSGQEVGESWFNPATDQTIIRPLTRLPATVSVQAPDENLWIYSIMAAPEPVVNATTITQIIDLPY